MRRNLNNIDEETEILPFIILEIHLVVLLLLTLSGFDRMAYLLMVKINLNIKHKTYIMINYCNNISTKRGRRYHNSGTQEKEEERSNDRVEEVVDGIEVGNRKRRRQDSMCPFCRVLFEVSCRGSSNHL